jgi:hypothetical protein
MHWLARNSDTFALGFAIARSLTAVRTGVGHGNIDFAAMKPFPVAPEVEEKVLAAHRPFAPAYGERLRELVALIRGRGSLPVLITQAAIWGEGVDPATGAEMAEWPSGVEPMSNGIQVTVNGRVSWRVLELYNDETRAVGRNLGVPVIDLARMMPKDSRLFYDWYHVSNAGAIEAGRILARGLCPLLRDAFPEQKLTKPCNS